MYKYQCSKKDCESLWTVQEGNLNGFVLTCPVCGKGRGIFIAQTKRVLSGTSHEGVEEMQIVFGSQMAKCEEDVRKKVNELGKRLSLKIIDMRSETNGKEYTCTLLYKKDG